MKAQLERRGLEPCVPPCATWSVVQVAAVVVWRVLVLVEV